MVPETQSSNQTNSWSRNYAQARVVVLGSTGFIGQWVSRYLSAAHADLHLVARDRDKAEQLLKQSGLSGTVWTADLTDPHQAGEIVLQLRPSIVFNLAGYGVDPAERDDGLAYKINAQLVEVIAQAMLQITDTRWQGTNLVHVGSALEYGEIGGDLVETSTPNPTTLYGRTKLQGTSTITKYGQSHGLKGITARLFTVYGSGEHPGRLLPTLFDAALTGKSVPLTAGYQKRDFVFVGDVAEGLLRLGTTAVPPGETINLATGRLTTVRHFTELVAEALSIPKERLLFGEVPIRSEEMDHDPVSIQRLVQRTGWQPPTSIVDGIQNTIENQQAHISLGF